MTSDDSGGSPRMQCRDPSIWYLLDVKVRDCVLSAIKAAANTLSRLDRRMIRTDSSTDDDPTPPDSKECQGDMSFLPALKGLDSVVELVERRPDLFLRYSEGPAADAGALSRDYEADVDLPGLSVTTIAPEPWWPRPVKDWVARRICKYEALGEEDGRFPWLLSGRLVATGPDHEPVVEMHQPIAMLTPEALRQAKQWYHRRFEVGRDSTE